MPSTWKFLISAARLLGGLKQRPFGKLFRLLTKHDESFIHHAAAAKVVIC